jgi:hypothetical protein
MTYSSTRTYLAIEFGHFVTSNAISGDQRHETDAAGHDPLCVGAFNMKRSSPDGFLILENVFEEIFFEGSWRECLCTSANFNRNCKDEYAEEATQSTVSSHVIKPQFRNVLNVSQEVRFSLQRHRDQDSVLGNDTDDS